MHLTPHSTPFCPTTYRSHCDRRLLWRHVSHVLSIW